MTNFENYFVAMDSEPGVSGIQDQHSAWLYFSALKIYILCY